MDFTIWEWVTVLGILVLIVTVLWWKFKKEIKFAFRKAEAEGTIINWMAAMQESKKVYYPMIEFHTAEGKRVAFRAEEMCEGEPLYERGTKVKVLYLAEDAEVRRVVYPK